MSAWLEVKNLDVRFDLGEGGLLRQSQGSIHALSDIDFGLEQGQTVGLIGESGSGKSTLGRAILHLVRPTAGSVHFNGTNLTALHEKQMRPYRQQMQMVFQDPFDSMNARMTVGQIIMEPLLLQGIGTSGERRQKAEALLERMGLDRRAMNRYPGQYSGGQRQRIAIARALTTEPQLLVLDEPTSGLDVSMQARILNLLRDLQQEMNLSYVFISHDLGAVSYIAQHIIVLYLGRVVEIAPTATLISSPAHPYTASLMDALPPMVRQGELPHLPPPVGEPPSPVNPPSGCAYHTRCPKAEAICSRERPGLSTLGSEHQVACHFPLRDAQPMKETVHAQ
ncbi:ABC transporter ATP-binding protein [Acidithiobacillus thiooxidans]|uniref:Oligopeptide transport ATP-binding protein AppF n=1 Tax=Acidithiobacillus thiooxidans ATCC 19377 TaxID=637390 RepID=A0A543Q022_ACITH|nr:ABC transporter ATP-binding protein [Acidithiobacillus thiooxidans]MDX5936334.1 ABC transporter ATP-binding protein [Acidithiobacillus thiooxidans]TQN49669.1 Oligopeptide transport ATP-binding protein AppF [Acidithiobacillus thiooxidans ATCC 19377]